jgi:hypothetical protein
MLSNSTYTFSNESGLYCSTWSFIVEYLSAHLSLGITLWASQGQQSCHIYLCISSRYVYKCVQSGDLKQRDFNCYLEDILVWSLF